MDNQFSEVLLNKLKNLILDIQERSALEMEAKDLERLNDIISGNVEERCPGEKEQIKQRILQRRQISSDREFAKELEKPGVKETLAEITRTTLNEIEAEEGGNHT